MKKKERFVALRFASGWVVWDNQKARISDGVYAHKTDAAEIAQRANFDSEFGNYIDRNWMDRPTNF